MEKAVTSEYEAYGEVTLTSAGVPIVLSRYPFSDTAPVVIFLPGTMAHPLFYDSFLCKLARAGFNVVGLHFISHGKSPRVREDFRFEDMVQNVRDTVAYCAAHYRGDLFLLGSSQGGIIATAAADDPRLKAVFVHDTILPELEESARLLHLPRWLYPAARPLLGLFRLVAAIFPTFQVGLTDYLDPDRVTISEALKERYFNDPLSRKSYPLGFLSSLFHADMHAATDGSIRCPFVLIAAKEDPLFEFSYIEKVYEKIVAPEKELMAFDLSAHILFIEEEDAVLGPIVRRLRKLTTKA